MTEPCKYEEIIKAVGGELIHGDPTGYAEGVSTDSRRISRGNLFVALSGERFDGNDYIIPALRAGAGGAIAGPTFKGELPQDIPSDSVLIRVGDTLKALQDLAYYYLSKFSPKIIAITGSTGKTTTKDMVLSIMRQRFSTVGTFGNFNNEVGLPLTVFNLRRDTEILALEMGMRGVGQIKRLTEIAKPDIAVVTNVGDTHIEILGSREMIAKAKSELVEALQEKGSAVLNADDEMVAGMARKAKGDVILYGVNSPVAQIRASELRSMEGKGIRFRLTLLDRGEDGEAELPLPGLHNVYNALAAAGAGAALGLGIDEISEGLARIDRSPQRLDIHKTRGGYTVINDVYNASPASMRAALDVLADLGKNGRKIAVLGDMLELGNISERAHYMIGEEAFGKGVKILFCVGESAKFIMDGFLEAASRSGASGEVHARHYYAENKWWASKYLLTLLHDGDIVLVKGSRGMKMEEIAEAISDHEW